MRVNKLHSNQVGAYSSQFTVILAIVLLLILTISDLALISYRYDALVHATNQTARDVAADLGSPSFTTTSAAGYRSYHFPTGIEVENKVHDKFTEYAELKPSTTLEKQILSIPGSPFCTLKVTTEEELNCALCWLYSLNGNLPTMRIETMASVETYAMPC